jgi:hypothetical protein
VALNIVAQGRSPVHLYLLEGRNLLEAPNAPLGIEGIYANQVVRFARLFRVLRKQFCDILVVVNIERHVGVYERAMTE